MSRVLIKLSAWALAIAINVMFVVVYMNVQGLDGGYATQLEKGAQAQELDDIDGAIEAYTRAINIVPTSPDAYFALADLLIENDMKEVAIETLESYILLEPRVPEAYDRLIALYEELNVSAQTQIELLTLAAELFENQVYADKAGALKISLLFVEQPTPDIDPGTYEVAQNIKITNIYEGDVVYYTKNGDNPDKTSTKYDPDDGISIGNGKTILRLIKVSSAGDSSDIASFLYQVGDVSSEDLAGVTSIYGNNTINGGHAAGTYYVNMNDGGRLFSSLGLVSNDKASQLNLHGDYIYYVNGSDTNKIYRVKADGTGRELVISDNVGLFQIAGNTIVYENKSAGSALYSANLDGTGKREITDDRVSVFIVSEGYVYYKNDTNSEKLSRVSLDSIERSVLTDDRVKNINLHEGDIYYMNVSDGNKIYRISAEGTNEEQVTSFAVAEFTIYGDYIYYRGVAEKGIFRYSISSGGNEMLTSHDGAKLAYASNYVYYINYDDGSAHYRVPAGGGVAERLP